MATPAVLVDHIVPVEIAPERRLDRTNLQPLCQRCHAIKTAEDLARYREPTARLDARLMWPNWLKPSIVPLTIVCGPPASGKSAWVAARRAPEDIVIDLDDIHARLSGRDNRNRTPSEVALAMAERNRMLSDLSVHRRKARAWFITSAASPHERDKWARLLQPVAVVVLATPLGELQRRLQADPVRAEVRERTMNAARRWWNKYEPRDGDLVEHWQGGVWRPQTFHTLTSGPNSKKRGAVFWG